MDLLSQPCNVLEPSLQRLKGGGARLLQDKGTASTQCALSLQQGATPLPSAGMCLLVAELRVEGSGGAQGIQPKLRHHLAVPHRQRACTSTSADTTLLQFQTVVVATDKHDVVPVQSSGLWPQQQCQQQPWQQGTCHPCRTPPPWFLAPA